MSKGIKTVMKHMAKDTIDKEIESNETGLTKKKVDSLIGRLSGGITSIALSQLKPDENLVIMSNEILKAIITTVGKQNDDELFVYTIEQLLIKIPSRASEVLEIVSEKYPQHKDFVDKLIILV